MKLFTLIENHNKLGKAEVEIQMIPGVPQIHFLGLPDKAIKESFFRIKSAFKTCGFKFPGTQQIIVNIKPNHLKKSSKGLELAVALGILHMTEQKTLAQNTLASIIYGELNLDGGVLEPDDLAQFKYEFMHERLLTGSSTRTGSVAEQRICKLDEEIFEVASLEQDQAPPRPPRGLDFRYSADEAEILFLLAVSDMHVLLTGPAGSGKSTVGKLSVSFKEPPPRARKWSPLVAPHHSITPAAFLGGGAQLYRGEIEKVQDGILFLDELLEFNPVILEALRSPMTGETLRLSRAADVREFDCRFQVVGTTNLCPCGKWTPQTPFRNCRFSRRKCTSYLERLSGPVLDRFGLLYFYKDKKSQRDVTAKSILGRIARYGQLLDEVPHDDGGVRLLDQVHPELPARRRAALEKAARIYARENGRRHVTMEDIARAEPWTYLSFLELERGSG